MFNPQKHLLALDFDGVIADSIAECLVAGYNAYARYMGKDASIHSMAGLQPHVLQEGRRLRNFIRAGQDYVYIQMAVDTRTAIKNQRDYDRFTAEHDDMFDDFFALFYEERQRMLQNYPEDWNRLNPLYSGIQRFLQQYPCTDNLYIVTTKKVDYAIEILQFNHIELIQSQMYQADKHQPKAAILQKIAEDRGLSVSEMIFIDDQVDTLIKTAAIGVPSRLAVWGYNNQKQRKESLQYHIPHLTLNDFIHFNF